MIVGSKLSAGPNTVNVDLNLGGSAATLTMRDAKLSAVVNAPTEVPAPPPLVLAPGLVVLETITGNGAGEGLCGDITVQSLAQIPVPSALTSGTAKCSQNYTYCGTDNPVSASCNSLLDVLVGGCSVFAVFPAVVATQPDVPAAGASAVVSLAIGANQKVTIPAAQETEAYSAYLQFAANRAHFTRESCTGTTTCQTGQTCTAAVCK